MSTIKIRKTANGILIKRASKAILLDPNGSKALDHPLNAILLSHSHSDHVRGINSVYKRGVPVCMSHETFRILTMLGYRFHSEDLVLLKPADTIDLNGIKVTAYNAGHILGSLMFEIDFGHIKVGYTGDFNFEDSLILRKADIMDVDILLIDATYGHPAFSFPPREILYKVIREKLREIVDLGFIPSLHGYALGKCQELTRLAHDFIGGIISVDSNVAVYNRIFEEETRLGLGNYTIGSVGDILVRDFKQYRRNLPPLIKKLIFTGWAITSRYKTLGFPLSSHSSFTKIIDYILRVYPNHVITMYNYDTFLASFIQREIGLKATPLSDASIDIDHHNVILRKSHKSS